MVHDKQSLLRALQEPLEKARGLVRELWHFSTNDWVDSIACCDVDQDSEPEIVVGSEDGIVYLLSAVGQKVWEYKVGDKVTAVLAADLDDDGQIEIVAGSEDGRVYILSDSGELHDTIDVGARIKGVNAFQDGEQTFITVGTEGNQLLVLDADGNRQWTFDAPNWVFCVAASILYGLPGLVAGGRDSQVYALDNQGQALWTYQADGWIFSICVADLDGDGTSEVVVGSRDNSVHVLKENGELLYKIKLEDWVMNVAVADVDGDGHPEIVAGSADGRLTIIDRHGYIKWRIDAGARMHSLACCDVNFDNRIEILVGLDSKLVRVFRLDPPETLYFQLLAYSEQLNELTTKDLSPDDWNILTTLLPSVKPTVHRLAQVLSPEELNLHLTLESQDQPLEKMWEAATGDRVRSVYPVTTPDGDVRIVVGCDDNHIYLLNEHGQALWQYNVGSVVREVFAADLNADGQIEIMAGSESGQLAILSLEEKELYTYQMPHAIGSVVAADTRGDGHLQQLVALLSQEVFCLTFPEGDRCWSYAADKWISGLDARDIDGCGRAEIVVASNDNHVHFLSGDGTLRWKYKTGNWTRAATIGTLAGEQVIVAGSDDHFVHVLDSLGQILWKYRTKNRVRAVQICDVDLDGKPEVVAGSADFCIYVLDEAGNPKWTFDTGGWVRSIACCDLNNDGRPELVVGSELKRVTAYRLQDTAAATKAVEEAWQDMVSASPSATDTREQALNSSSPLIKAYALHLVVSDQTTPAEQALQVVEQEINDADAKIRQACADSLLALLDKGVAPETLARLAKVLASDKAEAVRIGLADELARLAARNPTLAFTYLAELGKDPDPWVRRCVVRNLAQLPDRFASQIFNILLALVGDSSEWLRLEVAMALADFLVRDPKPALSRIELIAEGGAEPLLTHIGNCLRQPVLQTIARTYAHLISDQADLDTVEALRQLNALLEAEPWLEDAESVRQWTGVLQELGEARTVEELVDLLNRAPTLPSPKLRFVKRVHQILDQAGQVADALAQYQRREALFDRGHYLLAATARLESVRRFSQGLWAAEAPKASLERRIVELALSHAWAIIADALTQLRGAANLEVRLGGQQIIMDEAVVLPLIVKNTGRAPAENVRVQLVESKDFNIVGSSTGMSGFIAPLGTAMFEFTVEPSAEQHHVVFQIEYDDFSQKNVQLQYADQILFSKAPDIHETIVNPYIVGRPIREAHMFFGQRDTLDWVKSTLQTSSQSNVFVLHGERRFGKTSILYQLKRELTAPLVPVFIDMQSMAGVDTAGLLYRMSNSIAQSLPDGPASDLLSAKSRFDADPFFTFDMFLEAVEAHLPAGTRLILMIDEFEVLEEKVKSGRVDPDIFGYFRSLMQHSTMLYFIFTGTHTLELLSRDYWSIFFNVALQRKISFLDETSAGQLIAEPVAGWLTYDPLAIYKIKTLTANHPYFIQLICHTLVWHCQRQQKGYITITDVNAVIKEVLETGSSHIQYVWLRSNPNEKLILSALAASQRNPDTMVTLSDIQGIFKANNLPFDLVQVQQAIRNLIQRDMVQVTTDRGDAFRIIIDLFRLWLRENKAPGRVVALEGIRPTGTN